MTKNRREHTMVPTQTPVRIMLIGFEKVPDKFLRRDDISWYKSYKTFHEGHLSEFVQEIVLNNRLSKEIRDDICAMVTAVKNKTIPVVQCNSADMITELDRFIKNGPFIQETSCVDRGPTTTLKAAPVRIELRPNAIITVAGFVPPENDLLRDIHSIYKFIPSAGGKLDPDTQVLVLLKNLGNSVRVGLLQDADDLGGVQIIQQGWGESNFRSWVSKLVVYPVFGRKEKESFPKDASAAPVDVSAAPAPAPAPAAENQTAGKGEGRAEPAAENVVPANIASIKGSCCPLDFSDAALTIRHLENMQRTIETMQQTIDGLTVKLQELEAYHRHDMESKQAELQVQRDKAANDEKLIAYLERKLAKIVEVAAENGCPRRR